jgi:S-methylmethionine-dependent homocysteine/selenocysteine methylase
MLSLLVVILASASTVFGATLYVSPTGSDSGAGTITAPLKSIQSAIDKAAAGDMIYLRAGTYAPTTNIQIKKSGTTSAPYTLSAYSTEKVIIDGEGLPYTPADLDASLPSASRGILHIEKANYWKFYNLEYVHSAASILGSCCGGMLINHLD